MRLKGILIIILFVYGFQVNAQQIKKLNSSKHSGKKSNIESLKIGDKVPDLLISKVIYNNKRSVKIADFKNQLLILDFWDTYCGSCIEALPKLDSVQRYFGDKIKILAVTYQKEPEVTKFFNTSRFLKGLKPSCVVEDDLLRLYFKHKIISHEVWIYKGVVIAFSSPQYVNIKNIQDVLLDKPISWPMKYDNFNFDANQPLFSLNEPERYSQKGLFKEFSGITGFSNGLNVKSGIVFNDDTVGHTFRTYFLNRTIVNAYSILLFQSDNIKRDFIFTPGRLILEVKDRSKYIYDPKLGLEDLWKREHEFCYEMVSSEILGKTERIKKVIHDLNFKLNLNVRWEKRMVKCIIIYKANPKINPDTVSKPKKPGLSIVTSALPMYAFDMSQTFPPAIDETGYKGRLYLGSFSGQDSLRKELQRYGFDYKEEERNIEVMVITEKLFKP